MCPCVQRIKNSILLPVIIFGSETWVWNRAQHARVDTVEINYLRGVCSVTKACMKDVTWKLVKIKCEVVE